MARDTALVAALLAHRDRIVSREILDECVASWLVEPARAGAVLASLGRLDAETVASLSARADAWLAAHADDAPSNARYRLGAELGRGGLGRVVEAWDAELQRDVAVKLVLDGLPPHLHERFMREARLTARLEHPNIVPVHDLVRDTDGVRLCMKRIRGEDLATLLRALRKGDPEAVTSWSRPRLLRIFQDMCLGMAYAHSKNVVHRDLKPSNVMIGDYGEVLIVDWGLAKSLDAPAAPGAEVEDAVVGEPVSADGRTVVPSRASGAGTLTIEGDVVGTPHYMSPEQALGRHSMIDARSDIFSLGRILFELLTFRHAVEGQTIDDVMARAREGHAPAPSTVAPHPVPPELDAICLKAMARRRRDRYRTARELHDDVQLFLEGVKEREREHRLAEEEVARARDAVARHEALSGEAKAARAEAERVHTSTPPYGDKSGLWAVEDRAAALERRAAEALADAEAALTLALGHERSHREARRLRAELSWRKFLEAEEAEDVPGTVLHRRVAEAHNDGPLDALLKGDGTLTVRTRAYRCACLRDGRRFAPEELTRAGLNVASGRALDGTAGAEGVSELEPREPATLRAHGKACRAEDLEGAEAWLWRYEEVGRLLVPVSPPGANSGPDAGAALDRLFLPDSPFRPRGPGLALGRTPVRRRELPMGSYLLVLARDGFEPVRLPVVVPRCAEWEQDVTLFRPGEVPAGFIPVPEGSFVAQGDRGDAFCGPAEKKTLGDVLLARFPTTCREYLEFLNTLPADEARRRSPREGSDAGFYWPGPPFVVPTAAWLAAATPELRAKARRLQNAAADWEEDWPVFGISWEDAMAWCAWRRARDGAAVCLPLSDEWEKAARGPDRRPFPYGRHPDERWMNVSRSFPDGARPAPVTAFPHDESPYGIRQLAGNCRECCLDHGGPAQPRWRSMRGGPWIGAIMNARVGSRAGTPPNLPGFFFGFRAACAVRLE